ncbi:hypothetical protein CNMCM6106_007686 [Aspergillus hiratsukae]|uniref:Uncharacterized protein n=1 Tax=Aspergillus hiratsukae TaxID=1194566 RepID=A0A8H6QKM5_9EURO|nr:hypothetical protein CNMCM6106_007686 [Aspergillus hiratsukae]
MQPHYVQSFAADAAQPAKNIKATVRERKQDFGWPTVNPSLSRLTRDSSICSEQKKNSQPPDRIEDIKRQLLQATDWAAVGAARPLKISFTPVEEVEHFGKRRRLTEADRKRLTTMEQRALPPGFTKTRKTPRQNMSSDLPVIEALEIQINGRRCHAGAGIPKERQENFSSQPMLLDRDVSVWADQGSDPARSAREESVDGSLYRQQNPEDPKSSIPSVISPRARLSQSIITNSITSSRNASGLIQTPEFLGQDFEASMSTPLRYHDSNGFHSSSGSIIQNRFTIDDQIAAEKEMCSNVGTIVSPRNIHFPSINRLVIVNMNKQGQTRSHHLDGFQSQGVIYDGQ